MKILIITGGKFNEKFAVSFLEKNKYDYIICVDNGITYAEKLGIVPDMLVGDFDTRGDKGLSEYEKKGVTVRRYIAEKDDTDTEIAIREAVIRGGATDILCGTGGRIDHLLANIHNLKIALDSGVEARIIDECNVIYLKKDDFIVNKSQYPHKYISFLPFCGTVKGLKLKGFKYSQDNYDLKPGTSRCISNEISDGEAYVSFESGCLIVIHSSDG
ncbi:MAG: thiamine diphosphokinase [Butyrivibrio sp.]